MLEADVSMTLMVGMGWLSGLHSVLKSVMIAMMQ